MPKRKRPDRGRRLAVHVTWLASRNTYVLRCVDLGTGRQLAQKSADTVKRKDADRQVPDFLGKCCDQFGGSADGGVSWDLVCRRFDAEQLADMSKGGRNKWWSGIAKFDALVGAASLYQIDTDAISKFRGGMNRAGLSHETVIDYLAELGRCLRWAATVWTDYTVPTIKKPKRKQRRGPRGRPLNKEEVERMLAKTASVVGKQHAKEWRKLLVGLWLSGFRITEAMDFTWDEAGRVHPCDWHLDRASVYFRDQKSGKEGRSPITRAFDRWLRKNRKATGFVFRPQLSKGRVASLTASKKIAAIGRAAGVIVGTRTLTKGGSPTVLTLYASAHDFRRTFATRLAPRVRSAAILAMYLRDTMQTAQQYYVDCELEVAERAERPRRAKKSDQRSARSSEV